MNHSVIIPEFIPYEKIRSFIPEVVKIQKGDNVKWINASKDFHNLYFFGLVEDLSKVEILEQLQIGPGESKELTFNYDYSQIDYICKEHTTMKDKNMKEHNSISIFIQNYCDMSNTERLTYLSKRFNIRHQYLLSRLDERE
jgi:Copper binding proteins, plastocyanin/azurin family